MLQALPGVLAAAQVPAWRLIPAAAGCVALVFAATFITRVEKRLPLVYYKKRRKVSHLAPHSSINSLAARSEDTGIPEQHARMSRAAGREISPWHSSRLLDVLEHVLGHSLQLRS